MFGNANVFGLARISGEARIFGFAAVSGKAQIFGQAWVYDTAQVSGMTMLEGTTRVCHNQSTKKPKVRTSTKKSKSEEEQTAPLGPVFASPKVVKFGIRETRKGLFCEITFVQNTGFSWQDLGQELGKDRLQEESCHNQRCSGLFWSGVRGNDADRSSL